MLPLIMKYPNIIFNIFCDGEKYLNIMMTNPEKDEHKKICFTFEEIKSLPHDLFIDLVERQIPGV